MNERIPSTFVSHAASYRFDHLPSIFIGFKK